MKKAFVFPGQGAQFVGMGKDLYENSPEAKELFEKANEILGFRITDLMFEGTDEDLKQTKVTQPAIFLHSVILAKSLKEKPDMVAGHSLGEFSALVANGTLSFEDGLRLVHARALAMQKACEANPSTMAAILGLPDETVENILAEIDGQMEFLQISDEEVPATEIPETELNVEERNYSIRAESDNRLFIVGHREINPLCRIYRFLNL